MNRRLLCASVLGPALFAAAAFAPAASAGNVAWNVSVGGPGFAVTAGQPGYYGGHGYYGAPYRPYHRVWYRPLAVPSPIVVAPAPAAYPYYEPAPVVYAPRPVAVAPRPIVYAPRAYVAAPALPRATFGSY
jgi:hypothetical protein